MAHSHETTRRSLFAGAAALALPAGAALAAISASSLAAKVRQYEAMQREITRLYPAASADDDLARVDALIDESIDLIAGVAKARARSREDAVAVLEAAALLQQRLDEDFCESEVATGIATAIGWLKAH